MNCTWDPRKNRTNLARHGLAFEDAIGIFQGPTLPPSIIATLPKVSILLVPYLEREIPAATSE